MEESTKVLAESLSPICRAQAVVEESDTCIYFYLWIDTGGERPEVRSCWVCNTAEAPEEVDRDAMLRGEAPRMPLSFISHNPEGIHLEKERLHIEWFEEGDAAALLEEDTILAVIPGWSGFEGFCGYSKYAKDMGEFAWELTEAEAAMEAKIAAGRRFWNRFEDEGYWERAQQIHLEALENFFGPYEKYYAIDNGQFPPKALLTGRKGDISYAITLGVSLIVMPKVEQYYQEEAGQYRRIELGFAYREDALNREEVSPMAMFQYISAQSCLPWREDGWLGHGHTVPCSQLNGIVRVLFVNASLAGLLEKPEYPLYDGERINLLYLVPLTQDDFDYVVEMGSVEALRRYSGTMDELIVYDGKSKFTRR